MKIDHYRRITETIMQLGAFIITFNRPQILKKTLQIVLQQSRIPDLILIVDNGNAQNTKAMLQDFKDARVIHHHLGDNPGCAAAQAYGLQWLSENGFDWIYCVDDDDPPLSSDTVERLLMVAAGVEHEKDVAGVAAFGSLFDWTKGQAQRLPDDALSGVIEVDVFTGNSHYILRREAIQAVDPPDRRLFIDFEDYDYFLRMRRAGYRLLVNGDLMREYRTRAGRLNLRKQRLPRSRKYPTPWRRYYSTRNYIFSMLEKFHRPDLARREALKAVMRSFWAWRLGLKKGAEFSCFELRGVLDGYLGRMGRTVKPKHKYQS